MSDGTLKPGWTRVAFGDVVRQVKDKIDPRESGLERYIAGDHMDTDDLRIRRWGTIGEDYLGPAFHMRFKPGQVLYGSRRTYLRKVAVPDFAGITANTTYVIESKDQKILLPELLPFIMQTEAFHEHSIGQSKGSVNPYINFSDIAWFEFALPPVREQERIVRLLQAVEDVREGLREIASAAHRTALSRVHTSLQGYQTDLVTVGQLSSEPPKNGFSPSTNAEGVGLRTVSIGAVRHGFFHPQGFIKHSKVDPKRVEQFLIKEHDIFVVRGNGNKRLTGRCGISARGYADMFYPDLLIRLRLKQDRMLPLFAALQWNLPKTHQRLISRAKSTNGIWKINGQDIRQHALVVPPIDVQRRVMTEVSQIVGAEREAHQRRLLASQFARSFFKEWGRAAP